MNVVDYIETALLKPALEILAALAVLLFFWGVFILIYKADDPEEREKGRQHLIYGVLGLFIIISVNAILSYVGGILTGI